MTTRRLATLGVALALGAIAAAPAAAGGGYTITDLGTFGGTFSSASAVNDSGVVVGQAEYPNGDGHAFLYEDSLPLKDLGTLGGSYSYANDVNANAEVVGDATNGADNMQGFRWLGAGSLQLIPTLGGLGGFAAGVNDAGVVVGVSNTASGPLHGYLYDGSLTDVSLILAPLGATQVVPYDVNASKEVVGQAILSNSVHTRAFRWTPGQQPELLATLGGEESGARAVNAQGVVVGYSTTATGSDRHAVAWAAAGSITEIGSLGGPATEPQAVNDVGQIAGLAITPSGDLHGFLYTGGVLVDANDLLPTGSGWTIDAVNDVNDKGQLVGGGFIASEYHAFLLTPNTPAGANVVSKPVDGTTGTSPVSLTFANITQGGGTTLTTSASGPAPPAGFNLGNPATYYELATSASFAGLIEVCIDSTGIAFSGPATLWHYEGGAWVDVTASVNGPVVCGSVSSLSPFALFAAPPAAAFQVCLLYDPGKAVKAGSTIPIRLQLCDAAGANQSSPAVGLHAQGVKLISTNAPGALADSGNANPDSNFRYDATLGGTGGYVYNLSTKGLATGTYALEFTAGTDPHVYAAQFQVR